MLYENELDLIRSHMMYINVYKDCDFWWWSIRAANHKIMATCDEGSKDKEKILRSARAVGKHLNLTVKES